MRRLNCWVIASGLLATLVLTCATACRTLPIPVIIPALGGPGILATLLLCAHRERLHAFLNSSANAHGS